LVKLNIFKGEIMPKEKSQKIFTPKTTLWISVAVIIIFIAFFVFKKFSIVSLISVIGAAVIGFFAGKIVGNGIGISGIISTDGKGKKGTLTFEIIGIIIGILIALNFF